MNQNLVSIEFSAETLTRLDGAIGIIEEIFAPLIKLSAGQVSSLNKMGDKSEHFCRQTLAVLEQNRGILPADFDLGEVQRDLLAFDTLRPRLRRIRDFMARGEDTEMALGSDVFTAALQGYALMKLFSKSESLEDLREAMAILRPGRKKPAQAGEAGSNGGGN